MTRQIKLLSALVLGLAVALVGMQVLLRYLFNSPLAWAEEVGRYLFVWSVFLGAAAAMAEDRHIRITVLTDRLGPKADFYSRVLGYVLGLLSFSYVAWFGYLIAWSNRATGFYTIPALPRILFYLAVPVSMTIMSIYLLAQLERIRKRKPGPGDNTFS